VTIEFRISSLEFGTKQDEAQGVTSIFNLGSRRVHSELIPLKISRKILKLEDNPAMSTVRVLGCAMQGRSSGLLSHSRSIVVSHLYEPPSRENAEIWPLRLVAPKYGHQEPQSNIMAAQSGATWIDPDVSKNRYRTIHCRNWSLSASAIWTCAND
jgi:hypothetical protein